MIKLEINGVTVEAKEGSSIIENADRLAIPIPRFCYHNKLSVAANCRMCLVHVENSRKPLPACATPVAEGMKVWTESKEAIAAQRSVMEFLLINHPLDCPICDQGGECELQDTSMNYGQDFSRYDEPKRTVYDQNLGPLIATDMTRCIQCTRCVRFGAEISGERELGATGRGEHMEIGTFIEQNVNSEVSGNVIDLCPVGALTSKPFRFRARAWELNEKPSIAPHDCIGSNVFLHVYNHHVLRVVPRENEKLNEVWLSDRDRFSYTGILHDDRLRKPMLRKQDKWQVVSWVEGLKYSAAGIKLILENYSADELGILVSPSVTIEEQYLLQKFARSLGANNIDHRLRQADFRDQNSEPLYPSLGIPFADLESQDAVLLIGSHLSKEHPNAALKLRKLVAKGGTICTINPVAYKFNFTVNEQMTTGSLIQAMQQVLQALQGKKASEEATKIANLLQNGNKKLVMLGQLALQHPRAMEIKLLARQIAQMINGNFGLLSDGANAAGAWLSGCVPHRLPGGYTATVGKNAREMLETPLRGYILYAVEPAFDSLLGEKALTTLREADFVIAISSYQSDELMSIADVILPISVFAEITGNFVNIDGSWQTVNSVVKPFGESRPGWKVLRVLANLAEAPGFEYIDVEQVTKEIQAISPTDQTAAPTLIVNTEETTGIQRFAPVPLYAIDSLVRRALPLQQTTDAIQKPTVQMNVTTAKQLGLVTGDLAKISAAGHSIELAVMIDDAIADKSVIIYQAKAMTNALPAIYNVVEVKKC